MNEIKLNKKFYKTLDNYLKMKDMSRCRLSRLCGKDATTLNPSKMTGKRWITVGFFLRICEALEITPQEFFNKLMEEK